MKAIMVTFDSLNRRYLPAYGNTWVKTPNFERLQEHTVAFSNCYAGSLPCMPARRELHTGRYNFLHAPWGCLEPYDDSMPQILKDNGVHSHLVSDHYHYWEDNGNRYHQRYSTWQAVRGQEGDPWIGQVAEPVVPETVDAADKLGTFRERLLKQDLVNREYMRFIEDHTQTRTFNYGCDFIERNAKEDKWFLHIECFDPHEPFFSPEEFHELYPEEGYTGAEFEWPNYDRVKETESEVEHARKRYAALLSFCDRSLGRILSLMDEYGLWDDTMLILNTDHGYLLGEHGWWAKNTSPTYNEIAHTPLFIWDPRSGACGQNRDSLVQTIDLPPTILGYFGINPTPDMTGRDLAETVRSDKLVHEAALFGYFGGQVNCTDGRYLYMRGPRDPENTPLAYYTAVPGHGTTQELQNCRLHPSFPFTKGVPLLEIPKDMPAGEQGDTLLFDLKTDPGQHNPIEDTEIEKRMVRHMQDLMNKHDAPSAQFQRLGL